MPDPLCRLSVQHGSHTMDLALPRETPVGLLLPSIVDLVHQGTVAADEGRRWRLSRVGDQWLDEAESLLDNDIRDGELLLLTTMPTAAPVWTEGNPWHCVIGAVDTERVPTPVTRAAAGLCWGALAAVALGWAGVETHATANVVTGVAIACVAAVGAVVMRRAGSDRILCLTLSIIAVGFAAVAAFLAVPGASSMANPLLAAAVAGTASIVLLRITRCGAICLTAAAAAAALTCAASATAVVWILPLHTAGAALTVLSLGALGASARLSIAVAGLVPGLPVAEPDRALTAHSTLTGLVIGSAGAATLGIVLVVSGCLNDDLWPNGATFAAVVGLVLMLRARTHVDMIRRTVLIICGTAAVAAGGVLVAVSAPALARWLSVLMAVIGLSVMGAWGATANPLTRRGVEMLEYAALAAVVPLACWVAGLYGLIRGLSLP